MKVLLINGSPNQTGCTYTALHEVETTLQANGIETELLYLGKKPIAGCIACGACMNTGHCFRDDLVQEIQKRLDEFDAHRHRFSGLLQCTNGATRFVPEPPVLRHGEPHGGQARRISSIVPPWWSLRHLRAIESIFHYCEYAYRSIAILELGTRLHTRRCAQGQGRLADHAHLGAKYGVVAKVH